MSVGTGVWRSFAKLRNARTSTLTLAASSRPENALPQKEMFGLVRQLFFPSFAICRRRIFFVAPGPEVEIAAFCERVGRTLVSLSGNTVAIVSSQPSDVSSQPQTVLKRLSKDHIPGTQVGENLWSLSSDSLLSESADHMESAFGHFVLGASVADPAAPLFAGYCRETVLVIAANRTRREAALRSKELLSNWNADLLGAVLDDRTFPVPESIYRRL